MFKYFQFEEVLESIKEHRVRNLLSGLGIAWGIFILILLLGAGNGLQEGVFRLFGSFSKNSLWIIGGRTSKVEIGKTEGKKIIFDEGLLNLINHRFNKSIKDISPEITLKKLSNISYKDQFNYYTTKAVSKDYFKIKTLDISEGRLFNSLDEKEERRVVIIGKNVKKVLFEEENPIGMDINVSGNWFKVIGVLKSGSILNQQEQSNIFIPYSTCNNYLNLGNKFSLIMFNLFPGVNSIDFEKEIKFFLSRKLDFDPEDKKAIRTINFEEQIKSFNKLFDGLDYFFWFVGICLLLVGMVGVGNISLVIVKERTKEIGVRKAIGATSKHIISMILSESILITVFSGSIGLFFGYSVLFLINLFLATKSENDFLITELNFNILASVVSIFILVISGAIAGFIPAKKATKIKPIEAIRQE